MDQIKIGQYIASKRKSLGMTQEQLAEKLGKSRKAVSKWERGVCLPEVSIYTELCDILGITLNEFFAGEDIEQADVADRSEKNLLGVARDGSSRSNRLKRVIIVIAAAALILASVLGWIIKKEGYFMSNYIKSLDNDSGEGKMAEMLSDGYPVVYKFNVGKEFTYAEISVHKYVGGVETEEGGDLRNFMEGDNHHGTIALIPDILNNYEVRMILATDESMAGTGIDIRSEIAEDENYEDYQISFTGQPFSTIKVKRDKEIPIGILYACSEENDTFTSPTESFDDIAEWIKKEKIDYVFLFTVKFGADQ